MSLASHTDTNPSSRTVSSVPDRLDSVNFTFIPEESQPLSPREVGELSEIDKHRSVLFQSFEQEVIRPFAIALAEKDANSIVKVAGSHNDPNRSMRLYSDVDMIVLSPMLKAPEAYLDVLFKLSELANEWKIRQTEESSTPIAPVFFTRALNEMHTISMVKLASDCDPLNIVPCHFLFYRDEAELIQREQVLGDRLLSGARPVLNRSNTDAVFRITPESTGGVLDGSIWSIERAMADFVLNRSFLPADVIAPIYATQLYLTVRRLVDDLPITESDKTVDWILGYLDPDKGNGLRRAYRPIEDIRNGAICGKNLPMQQLLAPAAAIIRQLHLLSKCDN